MTSRILRTVAAGTALALTIAACSPVVTQRGYIPNEDLLDSVRVGVDNKESVLDAFGSPSSVGTVEGNAWYYISSTHEQVAFFKEEAVDREIVVVYFDDGGNVQQLGHYGLEDGRVIDLVTRETPTRGKELTFLQQMFGNLGKFGSGAANPTGGAPR